MKYRFYLDMAIQYLILALAYPSIEAQAMANRPTQTPGGELFLWLVPVFILFIRWSKAYDKKRARGVK